MFAEAQHRVRKHREEAARRQEMVMQRQGKRDHLGAWRLQTVGPECLCYVERRHAVGRRQNPRLVDQISKSQFASTYPFAFGAGHNDELIVEEDFCVYILLKIQSEG